MAHIIASPHTPPVLPRSSVFQFLFPPAEKRGQYYKAPDPNSVAFIDGLNGDLVTRQQVEQQALELAAGLQKLGVKRGDVGMTFGFNSLQYVNAIMGMQAAGCIVSPANAAYAPDELLHQLTDSTASFIFIEPQLLPTLKAALETASKSKSHSRYTLDPKRIILLCADSAKPADVPYQTIQQVRQSATALSKSQTPTLAEGEEKDTAYLCYSSGTTGRAKGVETTHHNMTSQVQAVNLVMEPLKAGRDRVLGILPFSHIYGLTLLIHYPIMTGVPIVVLPRFDEIGVLENIQKHKITFAYVVPPVLLVLLHSANVPKYDISSLRGVMSGAAPLSSDLAHAVQDKLKFGVTQGYGLTETSPVSHVMTVQESQGRKGRIGKLMPTYQARLVTEDGKDVVKQGAGERGELWLRGPSVMKGYWRNKEATQNTFAEGGWFMTGDVAEVDSEGYFAIVDRVKELIKYKGFQVPPAELEALLLTHPKVADAAVIAYPSPSQATELPRAYIVPVNGLDSLKDQAAKDAFSADVAKWIEGKVANHKRLRGGVVLIEAIPKSPSGKILRKDLRAMTKKEIEDKVKSGREAKL